MFFKGGQNIPELPGLCARLNSIKYRETNRTSSCFAVFATSSPQKNKQKKGFEKELDNLHVLLVDMGDVAPVNFQHYVTLFFKIKLDPCIVTIQS